MTANAVTCAPLDSVRDAINADARSANWGLRRWWWRTVLRLGLSVYLAALWATNRIRRRPRALPADGRCEILLTGTFHSDNWINAHLRPLAASQRCARLIVVTTYPVPPTPNVTLIPPPAWLRRIAGAVGARLITFSCVAVWRRPHVIGGFHLLFNGLGANLLARIAGTRALYFCVGGPAEVLGGGIWSENRVFSRLEVPDATLERRLLRAVTACDLIITMGTRARAFFQAQGVRVAMHVISGGIDGVCFAPAGTDEPRDTDVILVGRLAQIKRVDIFLRAFALVRRRVPEARAMIVGDGEQRGALQQLAAELGVADAVTFSGQCRDIAARLRQARIFVLTSDSEGLALSLMEAMTCGLPAIVSAVGDLADLVEEGVNGHLVPARTVERFADAISGLLSDPTRLAAFATAARASARRHALPVVTRQWDEILSGLGGR